MENKFLILYGVARSKFLITFHTFRSNSWDVAYDKFKSIRSCHNCRVLYFAKLLVDSSSYRPIYFEGLNINDLRKKWWRSND